MAGVAPATTDDDTSPPSSVALTPTKGVSPLLQDYNTEARKKAAEAEGRAAEETEKAGANIKKIQQQDIAQRDAERAKIDKLIDQPHPKYPTMQEPPSPPDPQQMKQNSMGYLGAMAVLGAFGGKMIRNVSNAPLKAYAGMVSGWQEGNAQAYKDATQQWEQGMRKVLEMNRQQVEKYRAILEDRSLTLQEQMFKYKLATTENVDKIGYEAANAENASAVANHYTLRANATQKLQEQFDKIVDTLTQHNAQSQQIADQIRNTPEGHAFIAQLTPVQKLQMAGWLDLYPGTGTEAPKFVPEETDPSAGTGRAPAPGTPEPTTPAPARTETPSPSGGADGLQARLPPNTPPYLRSPFPPADLYGSKLSEWYERRKSFAETGHDITPERQGRLRSMEYPARTAGALSLQQFIDETVAETGHPPSAHDLIHFNAQMATETAAGRVAGGMSTRAGVAGESVEAAIPPAMQASKALPRGPVVPLNKLLQEWDKGISNPPYYDFMVKNLSLLNAYVRAMNPQGIPRIAERAEAHAIGLLSMATDQRSYEVQVRALWQEVVRERKAVERVRRGESSPDEFPGDIAPGGTPGAGGDPMGLR